MDGYYIGLMTGSSADAIDAALVKFNAGQPQLIRASTTPYPEALRTEIIRLTHGEATTATAICALDARIGQQLAHVADGLINAAGIDRSKLIAIGSHGQTVCHLPDDDPRSTLQLGDAAQIAELTGITTVADFRRRDMAAGGQGAPFAPAFHAACLHSADEARCVLNLGGIANITVLPNDPHTPVIGFDTGPANALLDLWVEKHTGARFDKAGQWAASGNIDESLLNTWLADTYFSKPPPKSTGRDYFNADWLQKTTQQHHAAQDIQATLVELTAASVAEAIRTVAANTKTVLVCGGGLKNDYLMGRLRARLQPISLQSSESAGLHPQWMESILMAWLAARAINKLPGNLPSVTGAKAARICGAIYPA